MLQADRGFVEAIERAVTEIEARTRAEVVVVAARRAQDHLDRAVLIGVGLAWAMLAFVVLSPWHFGPEWLLVELPIVGALGTWLAYQSPGLQRRLLPLKRRQAAARAAAARAFLDESVDGAPERLGVLVYVAALEDQVVLIADAGVQAAVPGGAWLGVRWGSAADPGQPGELDAFLAGLKAVGDVLAAHLPNTGARDNSLANAPRVYE